MFLELEFGDDSLMAYNRYLIALYKIQFGFLVSAPGN